MTQAELAAALEISAPSVDEHLQRLEEAGLVERIAEDKERKWKYYELTQKGAAIVSPSQAKKILFLLGLLFIGAALYFTQFQPQAQNFINTLAAAPNQFNELAQASKLAEARKGIEAADMALGPAVEVRKQALEATPLQALPLAAGAEELPPAPPSIPEDYAVTPTPTPRPGFEEIPLPPAPPGN